MTSEAVSRPMPSAERDPEPESSRAFVLHEIRGPLTVLRGYFDLLAGPLSESARAEALAGARSALARLEGMIDELDDVDIRLVPRRPAETACVCLRSLAQQVVSEFKPLVGNNIEVSGPEENVLADAGRVRQAIANLVANAVAYGPDEGRIVVHIESLNDHVQLAVEDEGPGIHPSQRESAFETGRRLETGAGVQGSGLGLPIVRAIARAHGGDARAEDPRLLSGARLVIELPASR